MLPSVNGSLVGPSLNNLFACTCPPPPCPPPPRGETAATLIFIIPVVLQKQDQQIPVGDMVVEAPVQISSSLEKALLPTVCGFACCSTESVKVGCLKRYKCVLLGVYAGVVMWQTGSVWFVHGDSLQKSQRMY